MDKAACWAVGPLKKRHVLDVSFFMEQVKGLEPSCSAWEADILPLNYTCESSYSIPHLRPVFNPAVLTNFIFYNLCVLSISTLAFCSGTYYNVAVNQKRRCCGVNNDNRIPAQDIDELIFGADETVTVSER